jgi:hypothetical protein
MGMSVIEDATATATQCEFMENGGWGVYCECRTKVRLNGCTVHHNECGGLWACNHTVVDLHGTKTAIHSNEHIGIVAVGLAKVNIHLPSQHNTTHDNIEADRYQEEGGSIANSNADGTFTHSDFDEYDSDEQLM